MSLPNSSGNFSMPVFRIVKGKVKSIIEQFVMIQGMLEPFCDMAHFRMTEFMLNLVNGHLPQNSVIDHYKILICLIIVSLPIWTNEHDRNIIIYNAIDSYNYFFAFEIL